MLKRYILIAVGSLFFVGCGGSGGGEESSAKYLVSSKLLVDVNGSTLQTTFGYQAYKIVYKTTYKGEDINASGLLVLPTGYEKFDGFTLSMVCDAHGTVFADKEIPTANSSPESNPIGAGFSTIAGFAVIQPDLIGFGESGDIVHPYMLKDPSADASIDMIQAVMEFAEANSIPVNGQLFLSGYSEGGYVTMATLKEIEEHYSDTLKVMAAAPMEAPYDIDLMAQGILGSETMAVPSFPAFLAYSYSLYYDGKLSADQIISADYLAALPTLFDGSLTRAEIDTHLTYNTQELFTAAQISGYFTDPGDPFKATLVENSIHNWTPKSKMRIYHCDEDPIIPFLFAQEAYDNFIANGATDVELVTMHGSDHSLECAELAYPLAIQWFTEIKKANE